MHILSGTTLCLTALWQSDPYLRNEHFKDIILAVVMITVVVAGLILVASNAQRILRNSMQKRLLDKFSSAHDFAEFMQSPAGQKYMMSISDQVTSPGNSILSSVRIGIVLIFLGAGFVTASVTGQANEWLHSLGNLVILLGSGFLVAGIVAHFLAKKIHTGEKE